MNFQVFNLDFEKAEEPEIKMPISVALSKKQEHFKKTSISALLPNKAENLPKCQRLWLCGSQQTVENYDTTLMAESEEELKSILMKVKKLA